MTDGGFFQRVRRRLAGARTVELPVSCYGKLPIYKDFLREKMASKEAQSFKRWLDRGISHFWSSQNAATRGEMIHPHAFLLRFEGTGKYVVGYLWGSHDQGGLRFFPFAVFVSLPAGREVFPPHSVLAVLDPVIEAGRRWHQETTRLDSFSSFVQWSRGLKLEITLRPEREVISEALGKAEELTVGEYTVGLWESDAAGEWPALLAYLDRHRRRIDSHPDAIDLAARFPSSASLPMVLQAHYWSFIIERFDNRRDRPFQLLVPAYENTAGINVFLRNLRPEDVFAFHPLMPDYEHMEDFRETIPRRSGEEVAELTEADMQQPARALLDADFTIPSTGSEEEN